MELPSNLLLGRRHLLMAAPLVIAAPQSAIAAGKRHSLRASYEVRLLSVAPVRFAVTADLPISGHDLRMYESYPAELPAMASAGWPALVSRLQARDEAGRAIAVQPAGSQGWKLARAIGTRVRLSYIADFGVFQAAGWSSPLESGIADDRTIAVCARGLFLFTDASAMADVRIGSPAPWRPVAPWPRLTRANAFRARDVEDLTNNFLVFSRQPPDIAVAGGFRMHITAMGHWQPLRPLLRDVLQKIVTREVRFMGFDGSEAYNVILVPVKDTGGEAYRQSFVYANRDPSPSNVDEWANTMAHEIFHYWNYARLQGADYASTQWFQEGFTEYVANRTLVNARIDAPDAFLGRLGKHIANARKLTTTLENIGTHKGPPLYSAGALVAFCFDVMIREATGGRRDLGGFFRNLWRMTGSGARKYAWPDIEAALAATGRADWRGFYLRHIRGTDPLPLAAVFGAVGLKLDERGGDRPAVTLDPSASAAARQLWTGLLAGT